MARLILWYRIVVKLFLFFIFGVGSIILITVVFPTIRLFSRSGSSFKQRSRKAMCYTQKLFVWLGTLIGGFALAVERREYLSHLSGKIVVANHPSLLDVVMLLSVIPNADCIIKGSLGHHNIISSIVNTLYISNSLDFEHLTKACTKSLKEGNCLIIFPEGSRTKADGKLSFHRGAARIALYSGCSLVPVCIGGTDKYGLRKHDPMFSYNPKEKYLYTIKPLPEVDPASFADMPTPAAARKITEQIKTDIERALNR